MLLSILVALNLGRPIVPCSIIKGSSTVIQFDQTDHCLHSFRGTGDKVAVSAQELSWC